METPGKATPIRIGVFIPAKSGAQLLDMACVDTMAMAGREYLSAADFLPQKLIDLAPSVACYYISRGPAGSDLPLTANVVMKSTHGMGDEAVQPGNLDILLVPGPDPREEWDEEEDVLAFLRGHAAVKNTDMLSVCTGMFLCAAAGIFDGKQACGPRDLQDKLKKKYPKPHFVGDQLRWVRDGNLWSCGGVTHGNDLVAAYLRASPDRFPGPVVEVACYMSAIGDRPQKYEQPHWWATLGIVWQILKASLMGSKAPQK